MTYELQAISPDGNKFTIPKFYDLCLKISFQTDKPITLLKGVEQKTNIEIPEIPFKSVGKNDYLVDEMFDLSYCTIITDENVNILRVVTMGLFGVKPIQDRQIMSQTELYRLIGLPEPTHEEQKLTKIVVNSGQLPPVKMKALRYKKDQSVKLSSNGITSHIGYVVHPFLYSETDKDYITYNFPNVFDTEKQPVTLTTQEPVELLCL